MEIRLALDQDLANLSILGQKIFKQTFGTHYTTVAQDFEQYLVSAFSINAFRQVLADPAQILWVCDTGSLLAGFAVLTLQKEEDHLEISRLYLDPSVHGQGVAHHIMEQSLDLANQLNRPQVWLGVWQQNHRAIRFYAKWAFRIVGYKPFQLGPMLEYDYLMYRKAR